MSDEFARIAALRDILGSGGATVEVGIGDDAAVLRPFEGKLVASVDAQVEHVHFERAWLGWDDVGYRSLMAAASDLAAVGAEPLGAMAALILPSDFSDDDLAALGRGQRAAADRLGCPVVGGNLSRGGGLSVTTTVLGRVDRPLLRSGAAVGE
ncbi:MAG: thiamine-phosphate kinase, partial [Polyangiaceae bacterium]|nr:thiamine-phosphate kinase [Polyangiaceae bacterium]